MNAHNTPFGGNGQRVRDQILALLSEEYPLSVKDIFSRIKRNGHEVTYQAVHKVILQLVKDGILEKKSKEIQLSQDWVNRVKDYAFTVNTIYTKGKEYKLPHSFEKPHVVHLDNFSTYVVWIAEHLRDASFSHEKKTPIFGLFQHAVWPLRFNFSDFELLRQMTANRETRGVCVGDTPFDRWISTHYRLGGVRDFKTGIKVKLDEDYFVDGDIVIKVKFSPETRRFLDKIYAKIHDMKDLFHFYFTEVDKKDPSKITVTIERNPMFARMIENQVKGYLESNGAALKGKKLLQRMKHTESK